MRYLGEHERCCKKCAERVHVLRCNGEQIGRTDTVARYGCVLQQKNLRSCKAGTAVQAGGCIALVLQLVVDGMLQWWTGAGATGATVCCNIDR